MAGICLNHRGSTADFTLGGIVGDPVNVERIGGIIGDMEEGDGGAGWWVDCWRRVVRRVIRRHGFVGGTGTAHHVVRHL